ncbi:MAG: hypothetical protein AAFO84_07225, partial [Cyanobacteria bacterium J06598_1]
MTDLFTAATALKVGEWVVKDFLGPTAQSFCQDFLKNSVTAELAKNAPEPLQEAIAQSAKSFLTVFQQELENGGLPSELIQHEFKKPLKRLLADSEVKQTLGQAFDFDVDSLAWEFFQDKWLTVGNAPMRSNFRWQEVITNYVSRIKG